MTKWTPRGGAGAGRHQRRVDREAQRRRKFAKDRDRLDRSTYDPGPPAEDDWVIGDRSGLRRLSAPLPVGDAVDAFLGRTDWKDRIASTRLLSDWEGLVGPELAAHCQPLRLERGVLVISAEDHAWATQLTWLEATLRKKVNDAAGANLVNKVRIVVGDGQAGPTGPAGRA